MNDDYKPPVTDATVLPFNKSQRVFVPEEAAEDDQTMIVDVEPEPAKFIAVLDDEKSTEVKYEGFLVATGQFAGFADEAGIIQGLIPLSQLKYIKPDSRVDEDQVPF